MTKPHLVLGTKRSQSPSSGTSHTGNSHFLHGFPAHDAPETGAQSLGKLFCTGY